MFLKYLNLCNSVQERQKAIYETNIDKSASNLLLKLF